MESIQFTCNICGERSSLPVIQKHRELLHCAKCGSCSRFRGIIKALSDCVVDLKSPGPLVIWPEFKHIRGLGMSDSDAYAVELARVFDYTNTFYHCSPYFDVTNGESVRKYVDLDFIISSDVFEHIRFPVSKAFENIFSMLKPGGFLILSVPYLDGYETVEHFPHLHDYKMVEVGGEYVLVNRRRNGSVEVHRDLIFHGGPGSVLEMRVFGEGDLFALLHNAGFDGVVAHAPNDAESGYLWDDVPDALYEGRLNKSYVLTCRRPLS